MSRKTFPAILIAASLSLLSVHALASDPSLHQVYQAAQSGNDKEALSMMDQVLRNHPNSAKAHFVEAELLARQGRLSNAQAELATAERLDPGMAFAKPEAVRELRSRIVSYQNKNATGTSGFTSATGSNFPWGMILLASGLIALLVVIIRMMSQRTAQAVPATHAQGFGGGAAPAQACGSGGMSPLAPAGGGGMGSGILGGLAAGAAAGVGMVAGEALMHRMLDGHHPDSGIAPAENSSWNNAQPQYDMGGTDFGVADSSSWDDSPSSSGDDWS
ncbi:MAG: hypothetical protein K8H84_14380 [Sulfuricella denitrificans]|nr:hypothetical protein [Sulfuricella denitrificans]